MFVLVAINACSTEKDALLNKGFHNMTARYNGYFNAGEIIKESLTSYSNNLQEDYTKILPLTVYPSKEAATGMYPSMDDAIERCSKVIYKHAMPNPNKVKNKDEENCAWIDDNWLVIGQAHFVKREYPEAIQKFKYIKKAYKGEASIYAAKIWLAKTYIAQGEFSKAKIELDKVTLDIEIADENKNSLKELIFGKEEEGKKKKKSKYQKKKARKQKKKDKKNAPAKFSKKLKAEYEITFADLYIQQEDYKKAIEHLEKGIEYSKKKKRARYIFILAQLNQKSGNGVSAQEYYTKVAKSNAPYEMRFYAKINKALSATGGSEALRKDLAKMLKDAKNEEYKDQIYYVLAELDLKDGLIASAKTNLSRSVFHSINNDRQKGMSYLKLADLHFGETDYIKAQKYYDSCITVIPKSFENYAAIEAKANGLADLVLNYEIVQRQDSLQMIAGLSDKDREKFLKHTLKQIKENEIKEKAEAEARLLAAQKRANQAAVNVGSGSKWYFYNQKRLSNGVNAFRTNWGQIKLEDDWRRSNKESIASFDEEEDEEEVEEEEGLTVDDLRKDLPLSIAAIDSSNIMLIDALYNLGIIYKEQLKETDESISYFSAVIDKKIEHEKVLPAAYQLYLLHKKAGASGKAEGYKSLILKDYPNTDIAKMLLDPNYLEKKAKKDRKSLDEYSSTLDDYRYHRYIKVVTQCNDVINNDKNNTYINKYYLLKAFATSKSNIGGVEAVIKPLEALVALSPDSEEGKVAKEYLDRLKKGESIVPKDGVDAKVEYKLNDNSKHLFVLLFPNDKGDINPVKINIANFNTTFFKNDGLKMTNGIVGKNHQTVQINSFDNAEKAMLYLQAFKSTQASEILGKVSTDYSYFVISKANFILFYNNQDLKGYPEFFKKNYK